MKEEETSRLAIGLSKENFKSIEPLLDNQCDNLDRKSKT